MRHHTPRDDERVIVLRVRDAARALSMGKATLDKWRGLGMGPRFVRLGPRAVGYRLVDLEAWIADRVVGSTSEERPDREHEERKA